MSGTVVILIEERGNGECVFTHPEGFLKLVVHHTEIKREIQRILICECRCNERLKLNTQGSIRLTYTRL